MTVPTVLGVGSAAFLAGILNTAGGGGGILAFVALTAAGIPPLTAHATNQFVTPLSFLTAAPGARGHGPAAVLLLAGGLGTVLGVTLVANSTPAAFQAVAPWVLLAAALLVAAQGPLARRLGAGARPRRPARAVLAMLACGVYAGLIGIGTGTLALVVLGIVAAREPLGRLLRARNVLCFGMAVVVAATFALTGLVDWAVAALLSVPALAGGWVGTRLAGRLPEPALRAGIVLTAAAGAFYLILR